jgi:hypothetical protein
MAVLDEPDRQQGTRIHPRLPPNFARRLRVIDLSTRRQSDAPVLATLQ